MMRWGAAVVAIALACTPGRAHAEDADLVIVNWFDNLTYGGINTAIGLPVLGIGMIGAGVRGDPLNWRVDRTSQQLVLEGASVSKDYYSTGLFQHSPSWASHHNDGHEAGHSKQSAILGPLYLPLVGMSYLIQSHGGSFMEIWADAWRDLGSTMVGAQPLRFHLKLETGLSGTSVAVGGSTAVHERGSKIDIKHRSGGEDSLIVALRYGTIGFESTLVHPEGDCAAVAPLSIDVGLLSRDFQGDWSLINGALSYLINAKQDTGHVTVDFEHGVIQSTVLGHELAMGLRGGNRQIGLDALAVGGLEFGGRWNLGVGAQIEDSGGLRLTAAGGVEGRLHFGDAMEVYGRKVLSLGTDGSTQDSNIFGVETPRLFTGDQKTGQQRHHREARPVKGGSMTPVYGGAQFEDKTEVEPSATESGGTRKVKVMVFTVGGRF